MLISLAGMLTQIRLGHIPWLGAHKVSLCPSFGKIMLFWKFAIRKTYKPLMGPLLGNVTLPILILV